MLLGNSNGDLIYDSTLGGNNLIISGDGNDSIFSYVGNDTILSGNGDDFIEAKKGNKTIMAGTGNDSIYAIVDNAIIYGEEGNDTISVYADNSTIDGGSGNDLIRIHQGNNLVTGGEGDDYIESYGGNNTLYGGLGNDTIELYSNYTYANGGEGDDTYITRWIRGENIINDSEGNNTLSILNNFDDLEFTINGDDLIITSNEFEQHSTITLNGFMLNGQQGGSIFSKIQFDGGNQVYSQQQLIDAVLTQQTQNLVSAMASFAAPASATSNLLDDPKFDINQIIAVNI